MSYQFLNHSADLKIQVQAKNLPEFFRQAMRKFQRNIR